MTFKKKSEKESVSIRHAAAVTFVVLSIFLGLNRIATYSAQARSAAPRGKIAFVHGKPDSNVYVINADGANLTQLTHTGKDSYPS